MLLLFAILTEKSINVEKIILKEIHDCAKNKTRIVYVQSLITSLCLRAHVKTQANLKGQYVQGYITNYDLERLVEKVHELNQCEQEEPTKSDTKESTKETEIETNSVTYTEEKESDKELNSSKPVEGSVTPEPEVELEKETNKLSVKPKSTTPVPSSAKILEIKPLKEPLTGHLGQPSVKEQSEGAKKPRRSESWVIATHWV
ncbi:hypothetical protein PVK06_008721 [Gossypium arboreum]|uniref:Uncharacterized protein n=1 Tax=Gossypium arboreum TaxID=29729 RepID=A0ABR0QKP7_GOSAR|nr:hypothetical protein PVK06_008721 [Gossypium arboreum]